MKAEPHARVAVGPGSVAHAVGEVQGVLERARVPEARAEARDLVAAVLDQPRLWPSLHGDAPVDETARQQMLRAAERRARGAPFAYAVGRASFRHLTLEVDERVLIPRQETEVLVDLVLADEVASRQRGGVVIDIGTGSGAIALALASEGTYDDVIGTDLSLDALAVARANTRRLARSLHARVTLAHGSLLAPLAPSVQARVIVANPPYIAHEEAAELPRSVRDWEPALALFAGAGGMATIAALVRQSAPHLEPGGLLAMEVDSRRASLAAELVLADARYEDVQVKLDLTGRERFVLARRA